MDSVKFIGYLALVFIFIVFSATMLHDCQEEGRPVYPALKRSLSPY